MYQLPANHVRPTPVAYQAPPVVHLAPEEELVLEADPGATFRPFPPFSLIAALTSKILTVSVIDSGWCRAGYEEIIHDAQPASRG
jgi:hypothetical protein